MSDAMPTFPANRGPTMARWLRSLLGNIDSLIAQHEASLEHLDSAFEAGLDRTARRTTTQSRLADLAKGATRR